MIEKFIEAYVRKIVFDPSAVSIVSENIDIGFMQITIYVSEQDIGRLIGKDGKMIGAIKTFVSACKAKNGYSYRITVKLTGS